jgi:hypothetical protein
VALPSRIPLVARARRHVHPMTDPAGLPALVDAIRHLHACEAKWVESVPVHEKHPREDRLGGRGSGVRREEASEGHTRLRLVSRYGRDAASLSCGASCSATGRGRLRGRTSRSTSSSPVEVEVESPAL